MRWNHRSNDLRHRFAPVLTLVVVALIVSGTSAVSAETPRGISTDSPGATTLERGEGAGPARRSVSGSPRPRAEARFPERALSLPELRAVTMAHSMGGGTARPTALASGDFDSDGVPDLICGYATAEGGLVTFHAGNVDAIFPHSPDARLRRQQRTFSEEAFLSPARTIEVPVSPEFLAAGDFDGDDLWDVVVADGVRPALYLLSGDGSGGFAPAERVALPAAVTALAAGEINRADGLPDLAVGVGGETGAALLVFEGPQGALRAEAEVLTLDAAPTALCLGRFHDEPWGDVAVASGKDLLLLQGRDRHLLLDEARRAMVGPPVVERIEMPSAIEAVAWGDFAWEPFETRELALLLEDGTLRLLSRNENAEWKTVGRREVTLSAAGEFTTGSTRPALVPVRLSGLPTTDLAVLDESTGGVQVLAGMVRRDVASSDDTDRLANVGTLVALETADPPIAVLPMRLNADALSDLVLLLPGVDAPVVGATAPLASLTVNTAADNVTGGDGFCTLREAITNSNTDSDTTSGDCPAGSGVDTIDFNIGGGGAPATIAPLSTFPAITDALTIDGTTQGCSFPPCIALDGSGAGLVPAGLSIEAGPSSIRGLAVHGFLGNNVVGTFGLGIFITSSGNILEGNYIGTDLTGTVAQGNYNAGIRIEDGSNNTIGGTPAGARNLISGSVDSNGINLSEVAGTVEGNEILGNFIGTDVSGTVDLGNAFQGVRINSSTNTTVGGTTVGARNVISGNERRGVQLAAGTSGNLVLGNYIGTDVSGTIDLGNSSIGVHVWESPDNTVGGTTAAARNIISGNDPGGVSLTGTGATGNQVLGNFIGTDVSGTVILANGWDGVDILEGASNNTIGGATAGARNVISGNEFNGVFMRNATLNSVLGNFIGTDAGGTVDLGNGLTGVRLYISTNNTIGGTSAGARNIISGNDTDGVLLLGTATQDNVVLGNFIGTDVSGTVALGNTMAGVVIQDGSNNTIGGTVDGAGNLISANGWGLALQSTSGNEIIGNLIGMQADGTSPLGNDGHAIVLLSGTSNNRIGGTGVTPGRCDGPCNRIGFTIAASQDGVRIQPGAGNGNAILGNSISSNGELGIDLEVSGVTPNDPMDPDTGANNQQNFPVLSVAEGTPTGLAVSGTLNSKPGQQYRLEFYGSPSCDGSGHGEGARYLGFQNVTTDGSGDASFSVLSLAGVSSSDAVTATATFIAFGSPRDTSEFSSCVEATCLSLATLGQTVHAPNASSLAWTSPDDVQFVKGPLTGLDTYTVSGAGNLPNATSLDLSSDHPGVGAGFYYLVRPLACGSWQTVLGEEPDRDAALP